MIDYMWRVIMIDGSSDQTTVALFLLESDARKWAAEENKADNLTNYSAVPPKKS